MAVLASASAARADPGGAAWRGAGAEARLVESFARRGLDYPPRSATLIALKSEARLELWAEAPSGWAFVRSYLVLGTSGRLGPKLREGDHQVPEGVYRVRALNSRSLYHLALGLDYPNEFDEARGREDGRVRLGGGIMIHGDRVSDGCLPVGNDAIEELFALATRVGMDNVSVIISPVDLRRGHAMTAVTPQRPPWVAKLYAELTRTLRGFRLPTHDEGAWAKPLALPQEEGAGRRMPYDATDLLHRCQNGDTTSCARAGVLYSGGRGIAADFTRAWALLERACASGDALGCGALSELFLADDGVQRDVARAAALARSACDGGDGHGCARLAQLCNDRLFYPSSSEGCSRANVMRLRDRAVASLHSSCEGWAAYDCYTLGTIYASGDQATAIRFAEGSCTAGDPGGCDLLGALYASAGDAGRARIAADRACRAGYADSCARVDGLIADGGSAPARIASGRPLASW
jgi:TPR repeat protein